MRLDFTMPTTSYITAEPQQRSKQDYYRRPLRDKYDKYERPKEKHVHFGGVSIIPDVKPAPLPRATHHKRHNSQDIKPEPRRSDVYSGGYNRSSWPQPVKVYTYVTARGGNARRVEAVR
jgi:hypothetical protein